MRSSVRWWEIGCASASVGIALAGCGGGSGLAPGPGASTLADRGRTASLVASVASPAPTPSPSDPLVSIMVRTLKGAAYEGQTLYAFKDSTYNGAVTIGSGHLVPIEAAYKLLPLRKATGVAATDVEKHAAWTRLTAAASGHPATYYQQFTQLYLALAVSDTLLRCDIQGHINRALTTVPRLLALPIGFQVALVDIDFTVPGGLAASPRLLAAPDAISAYRESHRSSVSDVRNQQIMSLLLAAAQRLPVLATNPDITTRVLSVTPAGGGAVRVQPDSVYPLLSPPARRVYTHGMAVRMTAMPAAGAHFVTWSGGATGSSPTTEVVLDTDRAVTAQFAAGVAPSPTPPPQLIIQDLRSGTGAAAQAGNVVTVHYLGEFLNGAVFDSSYDRGQPIQFRLGARQVIPGWDQGLLGMRVGGKRKLIIPSNLAYGPGGKPPTIPADTPLLFEIELLAVRAG